MTTSGRWAWASRRAALGWVAVGWSDSGVVRILAAEPSELACERRLERERAACVRDTASGEVRRLLDRLAAVFEGERHRFDDVVLDQGRLGHFRREVYAAVRRLAPGDVATYGAVANAVGSPRAARAVGAAMAANPFPIVVPCHRVVGAGGTLGGFSMPGGERTKRALLELEGVSFEGGSRGSELRERASRARCR